MGYSDSLLLETLAAQLGVPTSPPGPLDASAPLPEPVDVRMYRFVNAWLSILTNIDDYLSVAADRPAMRNDVLKQRLNLLEPRVSLLEQLTQQLLTGAAATDAAVQATVARLELVRAAGVASDLRLAADEVRLAAVEAKATLTASATEANRLDIAKNAAADALRDARLSQDEAAITAAQATATQAKADAAAAQKKADDDAAGLLTLQAQLTQAKADVAANTASLATLAADVAKKLPADAVQRFTVATPAVTLAVGTPGTFNVVLPKAFADNQYLCFFTNASGSTLLNVRLGDTAKLSGSFTATMQQTGLASLAVAASSAEVLVVRLSN